jgi:8-amino-7-oxononanoate synthase
VTSDDDPSAADVSFDWVDEALRELSNHGLRRTLAARMGPQAAVIQIDDRQVINLGSNDYLGLAGDPRLARAATEACSQWGVGGGASPLVTGRTELHVELERCLAEFLQVEAALLFPTGFAANAGTIPALVDQGDVILADAKNHASLIDGCRLARSARRIYAHADAVDLESHLRETTTARRRLIVTDSLFSMDGDLAPFEEVLRLATAYDAMVLLDEAHAIGVFGARGAGVLEHLGLEESPAAHRLIRVGTLSKAFGASGGFVCGPRNLIEWLANRARTYVFSTAAPAPVLAAALAALEIAIDEPERRRGLLHRAEELRRRLQRQGWNIGNSAGQIIPVIIGDAPAAMSLAEYLRDRGYFVPGIRPPTVPTGESLLRISLCFHHTESMIDGLVQSLADFPPP